MKEFIPRPVNTLGFRERLIFLTISLCGLYDELITLLSFGMFTTNTRAVAVFEWFDDYDGE